MKPPLPCCGRKTEKDRTICCGRRWLWQHDRWFRLMTRATLTRYARRSS